MDPYKEEMKSVNDHYMYPTTMTLSFGSIVGRKGEGEKKRQGEGEEKKEGREEKEKKEREGERERKKEKRKMKKNLSKVHS
jgi:hypothetical protein